MIEDSSQKDIYSGIVHRVKRAESLSELTLKTIFSQLSRLPETYKLDFATVQLPVLLNKAEKNHRDRLLVEHYKHYVSLPCLAAMVSALIKSDCDFHDDILDLLNHIQGLQIVPGKSSSDREMLERMQRDMLDLRTQVSYGMTGERTVDLSSEEKIKMLAQRYYRQILSSFVSESDDHLETEEEFIERIKEERLKSEEVRSFASDTSLFQTDDRKEYILRLGQVLRSTIVKTYEANYRGIFNGSREMVLKLFEQSIQDRANDSETPRQVDLEPVTSGILAVLLELMFNSGLNVFREQLTDRIFRETEEI